MELMLNGRFPRLESTGIHFDDLGKIRILEEETRSQVNKTFFIVIVDLDILVKRENYSSTF